MKFKTKFLVLIIVFSLSIGSVFAIEEVAGVEKNAVLNIKDCVGIALQNSPKVKKARYNYGIAKGNVGISSV